jgi:hypothetical protein
MRLVLEISSESNYFSFNSLKLAANENPNDTDGLTHTFTLCFLSVVVHLEFKIITNFQ